MAEKKRKLPLLGVEFDVSEVPIVDMHEYFNEYKLEDGTVLKVKGAVMSIMRVDNQYLPDGNPVYFAFLSPVTKVESSPLKVPVPPSPAKVN
ncbi:MAG: hypothetical protein WB711_01750 [Terriglobales bacterium]